MSNLVLTNNGKIIKRNSVGTLPAWSSFIDDLFNDSRPVASMNRGWTPKVNIIESNEAFILEMAVPGYNKTDFVLDVVNDELSISADIKTDKEGEGKEYTRKEFGIESFKRTFTLPETVDEDGIHASYAEGILNVEIPKKEEAKPKEPRTIKIS